MEPMPMDQPPMEGSEDMGPGLDGQEPMGDQQPMDGQEMPNGGGSEIDDIFSQLDTEKQAAVIKYAKSQLGESKINESDDYLVTEIENEILADKKKDEKKNEKIKNPKVDKKNNPFITKY